MQILYYIFTFLFSCISYEDYATGWYKYESVLDIFNDWKCSRTDHYQEVQVMIKFLSNLFCKHNGVKFIRNIGGDEQMSHYVKGGGLAKSEWVCLKCNCFIYKDYRVGESYDQNRDS